MKKDIKHGFGASNKDTETLLREHGKPVEEDIKRQRWVRLESMRVNPTNVPTQIIANILGYMLDLKIPLDMVKVYVSEVLDTKNNRRVVIIKQTGVWTSEQFDHAIVKLGFKYAKFDSHNRNGLGLREAILSITADHSMWIVINDDGVLRKGGIGCIYGYQAVEPPVYLSELPTFIENHCLKVTETKNTTTLFLTVDMNSEISADFITTKMMEFADWAVCDGIVEIYNNGEKNISMRQSIKEADVPPRVISELVKLRNRYIAEQPIALREELRSIDSIPEVKLLYRDDYHRFIELCAYDICICPSFYSRGKSLLEYLLNWDFLINFTNEEKRTTIESDFLKSVVSTFYKEVDKKYAIPEPHREPNICKYPMDTDLLDSICIDAGLPPHHGDVIHDTRSYTYQCPNPDCRYRTCPESEGPYTDTFNLKSTHPTEEEKKILICPHCQTELILLSQSDPHTLPKCKYCEELGLNFYYKTTSDKLSLLSYHKCLNPDTPHEWTTPKKVVSIKGLHMENINSPEFFVRDGNIIKIGVTSDTYISLDLEHKHDLRRAILTPFMESCVNYITHFEDHDLLNGIIWNGYVARMKIWERNMVKKYKK